MDQVKESLDNERYPLIVSEGDSVQKLKRIESSSYLSHCARRFQNIQGNLFIYGSSLSEQDDHITEWITKNTTLRDFLLEFMATRTLALEQIWLIGC